MPLRITVVFILLMIGALATSVSSPALAQVAPLPVSASERVLFDETLDGNNQLSTTYSSIAYTRNWNFVDVFLTVAESNGAHVYATPQVSADGIFWADTIVYGQFETAPDEIEWLTHALLFYQTGNGTAHQSSMLAGRYMRVKLEWIGDAHVTVRVMFRQ